jgi:hypothetical protein
MWLSGYVECQPGFDAARCPDPVPSGYKWCMVYAGGSSATHAWDAAELARVEHLPRLPVWVPTPGTDDPVASARGFLAWLQAHGVPSILDAPHRPVHVLTDLETGTLPDPKWVNAYCDVLAAAGYWNLLYGSLSTILAQPRRSGYVTADWTGQPHLTQHAGVRGTQFRNDVRVPGGTIDLSVLDALVADQLWMP